MLSLGKHSQMLVLASSLNARHFAECVPAPPHMCSWQHAPNTSCARAPPRLPRLTPQKHLYAHVCPTGRLFVSCRTPADGAAHDETGLFA